MVIQLRTADTTITIIVNEVNLAPVLAEIASQSGDPGETVAFTAAATDEDIPANTLTFSLENAQPGMTIDATTGAFSWVISNDVGPVVDVTVVVTDDGNEPLSDSQVVTITVNIEPGTPAAASTAFCSVEATSTLAWTVGGQADSFYVEIDTNRDFSAPELILQTAETSIEAPLGGLKVNTVYYWRVSAGLNGVRGEASQSIPFRRWPATIQLQNTLPFPKATESADFRMVSVPGTIESDCGSINVSGTDSSRRLAGLYR